jgi:hypothetical protein
VDYFGAINKAAQDHGVHPMQMFAVFLDQLRQNHEHKFGGQAFNDGLDHLTGQHAVSWAESLHNFFKVQASMNDHNAKNARSHGQEDQARQLEEYNKPLEAFVAVLAHFLPVWNFGGQEFLDKVKNISQRVAKNPPVKRDDPPPAGYDEGNEPPERRL